MALQKHIALKITTLFTKHYPLIDDENSKIYVAELVVIFFKKQNGFFRLNLITNLIYKLIRTLRIDIFLFSYTHTWVRSHSFSWITPLVGVFYILVSYSLVRACVCVSFCCETIQCKLAARIWTGNTNRHHGKTNFNSNMNKNAIQNLQTVVVFI